MPPPGGGTPRLTLGTACSPTPAGPAVVGSVAVKASALRQPLSPDRPRWAQLASPRLLQLLLEKYSFLRARQLPPKPCASPRLLTQPLVAELTAHPLLCVPGAVNKMLRRSEPRGEGDPHFQPRGPSLNTWSSRRMGPEGASQLTKQPIAQRLKPRPREAKDLGSHVSWGLACMGQGWAGADSCGHSCYSRNIHVPEHVGPGQEFPEPASRGRISVSNRPAGHDIFLPEFLRGPLRD